MRVLEESAIEVLKCWKIRFDQGEAFSGMPVRELWPLGRCSIGRDYSGMVGKLRARCVRLCGGICLARFGVL